MTDLAYIMNCLYEIARASGLTYVVAARKAR
jgi:hypothetical protein